MKNTILKVKLVVMALGAIFVMSCSGEDGEDGATGAQGPAGIDGVDGLDGQDGTDGVNGQDGEDGNANVIASDWFGPDEQIFVSNGYTQYAEFDKDITGISPEVYETGTLMVYARFSNYVPDVWPSGHSAQLPLIISGGTTEHIYTYYFSETNLKIRYRQEGPAATWVFSTTGSRFRYVIVPSNVTGKNNHPNFSKMTYEEVMDYFNLEY